MASQWEAQSPVPWSAGNWEKLKIKLTINRIQNKIMAQVR